MSEAQTPGTAPLRLKEPPSPEWVDGTRTESDAPEAGRAHRVLCRNCATHVTDPALACERSGAHLHALTNPAGLTFDVALYEAARGCTRRGEATREDSWFPPATWTLAVCGGCGQQLGWFFDTGGAGFVGLIVPRIRIERDAPDH